MLCRRTHQVLSHFRRSAVDHRTSQRVGCADHMRNNTDIKSGPVHSNWRARRSTVTDAETLRNADRLWKLVHLVQDTIDKNGRPLFVADADPFQPLAQIRALADELDPRHGSD